MKTIDAVRAVAERTGTPTTHIGPKMGKSPKYFSANASRGSTPQADTVAAMAETMGYRLALVPRGDVPPSAVVIDPAE